MLELASLLERETRGSGSVDNSEVWYNSAEKQGRGGSSPDSAIFKVELAMGILRYQKVKRSLTGAVLSIPVGGTYKSLGEHEPDLLVRILHILSTRLCFPQMIHLLPWHRTLLHLTWR